MLFLTCFSKQTLDFLHLKKVDPSLSIWYIHLNRNEALQLASYFEANYFDAIVGKTLIDCFMTRKLMEDCFFFWGVFSRYFSVWHTVGNAKRETWWNMYIYCMLYSYSDYELDV